MWASRFTEEQIIGMLKEQEAGAKTVDVTGPGFAGGSNSREGGAMMGKTTHKLSPEVRERAVRLVLDHAHEYPSRWQAIVSISAKIGCPGHALNEWVKKAEVDVGKGAFVIDAHARRIVGRRVSRTAPCQLHAGCS